MRTADRGGERERGANTLTHADIHRRIKQWWRHLHFRRVLLIIIFVQLILGVEPANEQNAHHHRSKTRVKERKKEKKKKRNMGA